MHPNPDPNPIAGASLGGHTHPCWSLSVGPVFGNSYRIGVTLHKPRGKSEWHWREVKASALQEWLSLPLHVLRDLIIETAYKPEAAPPPGAEEKEYYSNLTLEDLF